MQLQIKKERKRGGVFGGKRGFGQRVHFKAKGYIAWQQLRDGDTWVDSLTWETAEDAIAFETSGGGGELAERFYSFINLMSCKTRLHTLEREQKGGKS